MSNRKEYIERGALESKLDRRLKELRKKHGPFDHYTDGFDEAVDIVSDAPAADVVEVVRCLDCVHYCSVDTDGERWCEIFKTESPTEDGFCCYGERKDGAE